jgi:hypothetical protein
MLSQCPSFLFIVPVSVVFNKVHVTNINEICLVQYISMKWQLLVLPKQLPSLSPIVVILVTYVVLTI